MQRNGLASRSRLIWHLDVISSIAVMRCHLLAGQEKLGTLHRIGLMVDLAILLAVFCSMDPGGKCQKASEKHWCPCECLFLAAWGFPHDLPH